MLKQSHRDTVPAWILQQRATAFLAAIGRYICVRNFTPPKINEAEDFKEGMRESVRFENSISLILRLIRALKRTHAQTCSQRQSGVTSAYRHNQLALLKLKHWLKRYYAAYMIHHRLAVVRYYLIFSVQGVYAIHVVIAKTYTFSYS